MKVVIFAIPERGHVNPFIGPAKKLVEQGASVLFASPTRLSAMVAEHGFESVCPMSLQKPPLPTRGEEFARLVSEPQQLARWIRGLLVDGQESLVTWCRDTLTYYRPDVVVCDPMLYAPIIAATQAAIPWVGWSTSLNPVLDSSFRSELLSTIANLHESREQLFAKFSIDMQFRCSDALSPNGTAVFATREVAPTDDALIALVGPSCPKIPVRPKEKLIYISYGSQLWYQPRRFDKVIAALSDCDYELAMSMGDLANDYRERVRDNVTCVEFADQTELLSRAALFITHGGANSLMEAMCCGTPMLVDPICNDQPHNARIAEECGVATRVDVDNDSEQELRRCAVDIMSNPEVHKRVSSIRDGYQRSDGAEGAAALVWKAWRR